MFYNFDEQTNFSEQKNSLQKDKIELQNLKLKLQNVNRTIENLLDKKIRIDLEIKKQKAVLEKYKKASTTRVSAALKIETTQLPLSHEILESVYQTVDSDILTITQEIDSEIDRSTAILEKIQELTETGSDPSQL